MAKTANINIRIDPETKARSEQLFAKFGITVTDAVNIFLHQSLMVGGLPFEMKQPGYNTDTEAAMQKPGTLPPERSRRNPTLLLVNCSMSWTANAGH